jgi:hypothetical protein
MSIMPIAVAPFYVCGCTLTIFRVTLEVPFQDLLFDIVSCQFAFHYCFESLEQVPLQGTLTEWEEGSVYS